MKRPATTAIAVFVAVIVVVGGVAAAVGWGTDGATAVEVGDVSVSRAALNDELRAWAGFEPAQVRTTPGAVDAAFTASVATQVVYAVLADGYLERTGEEVTAADREEAQAQVADPSFGELPGWLQERLLGRLARFAAVTRLAGDADDPDAELRVMRREARRRGVTVDPVYGRWSATRVRVVPYPAPAVG